MGHKICARLILKVNILVFYLIFSPFILLAQTLTPFEPNDPYFKYNSAGTLASFPGQWHLINNAPKDGITITIPDGGTTKVLMSNSGVDAGLRDAWKAGYTGRGVVIGIVDDGVEGTHEDITSNYRKDLSRNFSSDKSIADAAQGPIDNDDNHGQAVAGVAAARGGNGIGGTGAAPYAFIAGLNPYLGKEANNTAIRALYVQAYYWKSGVDPLTGNIISKPQINIMNHSYGQKTPWNLEDDLHGSNITTAINRTAANGIIHVWSAGNERGKANENTVKDNVLTNSNIIVVAAMGSDGKYTNYSNYGSNVFITAPSNRTGIYSGYYTFGITTTDRSGDNLGYNKYSTENKNGDWTDTFPNTNYTSTFGGTSSSAPLVSGILALGMEANKQMDVRMAKHILVKYSDKVDETDSSATGGWVKNGAGNWFNPNYGFGNINAGKFVNAVKNAAYVTTQSSYSTGTQAVNESIKYIDSKNSGGTSKSFTITTSAFNEQTPSKKRQPLEGVEINLNFTHTKRGDLTASITSPYSTTSRFLYSTTNLSTDKQDNTSVTNFGWTFLTNAFWGEDPLGGKEKTSGNWTITLGDKINRTSDKLGTWNSYGVTFLMGDIVFNSTGSTTTQTENIKARSLTINNSDTVFKNPSGISAVIEEKAQITSGELNVNGTVKMARPADDDDPEDGLFVLDGGILSGTGIIDAPYGFYHSSGTIKPGNSIGTLTLNGDYYQESQAKLQIEIASPASNDLLAINGSADLNGILETIWTGGYTPAIKTRFGTILTASSGITGRFSRLLTNITPTILFKPQYDIPAQVYLMVERDYINDNLLRYLTSNQKSIGSLLNSVGNNATGDLDTVLSKLDALPSYSQAAYALDQLAPRGSEAQYNMGISASTFQSNNIADRLSDLRYGVQGISVSGLSLRQGAAPVLLASAGSNLTHMIPSGMNDRWGFFIKGDAVMGNQKDTSDYLGYNFTTAGITLGSDYRFTKNFIAGVMVGMSSSQGNIDNNGSKVKIDNYSLGAYGTYYQKEFFIDGQVSYGIANYDNTRRIIFPGLDRTALSRPSGNQLNAYGGIGHDFKMKQWMITPALSLQYIKLGIDSYTERRAGAINLDMDKQNIESIQGNIGAKLSYAWQTNKMLVMPNLRASYGYEFARNSQSVTGQLAQGSSSFSVETASPNRNFLSLGTGITVITKNALSLYMSYGAQIGDSNYLGQNVNAGMRWEF
jgi:outer membrane autotransporter protein